jgi:putative oxidoreductase
MKDNKRHDVGFLILRIGLGLIILYYGSQKMFGAFGGRGYSATVEGFTTSGIPPAFAHLAIAAEFFGGLGILLGALTPIAAFGVACTMAVATVRNAASTGLLVSVFSKGELGNASRLFLPSALFFMALVVMILGAGRYSLDNKLFMKRSR